MLMRCKQKHLFVCLFLNGKGEFKYYLLSRKFFRKCWKDWRIMDTQKRIVCVKNVRSSSVTYRVHIVSDVNVDINKAVEEVMLDILTSELQRIML